MRTTVTLKDELSRDLLRFTKAKTLAGGVRKAVDDYLRRQKLSGILELRGKIHFEEGWDYKANRGQSRS